MSAANAVGYGILLMIVAGVFGIITASVGWREAARVFAMTVVLFALVSLSTYLIALP